MSRNQIQYISLLSDILRKILRYICSGLMLILTIDVLWGVFSRYVMGAQSPITEELARMLLICTTFFGGALAFDSGSHIGLDYLASKFEPIAKKTCKIISLIITFAFVVTIMEFGGISFVIAAINSANTMVSIPCIPLALIYSSMPISGIFVMAFLFEDILEEWGNK